MENINPADIESILKDLEKGEENLKKRQEQEI